MTALNIWVELSTGGPSLHLSMYNVTKRGKTKEANHSDYSNNDDGTVYKRQLRHSPSIYRMTHCHAIYRSHQTPFVPSKVETAEQISRLLPYRHHSLHRRAYTMAKGENRELLKEDFLKPIVKDLVVQPGQFLKKITYTPVKDALRRRSLSARSRDFARRRRLSCRWNQRRTSRSTRTRRPKHCW